MLNRLSALKRYLGPVLLTLFVLASLAVVTLVYATGEMLLAGTILVMVALSLWIYSSAKAYAYRYLFPAIAAALIFVVFPMVYTVGIGFTNYSSTNLLDFKRATQYFLEETYQAEGAALSCTVHPDGARFRLRLEDAEGGKAYLTEAVDLSGENPHAVKAMAAEKSAFTPGEPLPIKDLIERRKALKALNITLPDGLHVGMTGLREFSPVRPQYTRNADGSLTNNQDGTVLKPNFKTGFYETASGDQVAPGFHVGIGWKNYRQVFTDKSMREPFVRVFLWTLAFSALTVLFASSLGLVLAVLLSWDSLRFRSVYRLLLFLPYAVPGFISILVFKGLFNNNMGEINLILDHLFGIKPTWFSDPFLARSMILIVNTWLGFPYMMIVCMGLIKAIPQDLYEASAVAGAGPITNLVKITLPLIRRPLMPILISSFAFNFNNFVLISLLTGGRPDFLDTSVPAGTTDILVSYTYRMAFQDSGQQFGLAAAISTVIFLMVAALTLIQIRSTRITEDERR